MAYRESDPAPFEPFRNRPSLGREIWQQLADRLQSAPEPDLHLESKPIAVKDIWSRPDNAPSRWSSLAIHVAVIGILLLPLWRPVRTEVHRMTDEQVVFIPQTTSLPAPRHLAGGGTPLPVKQPTLAAPKPIQVPQVTVTPVLTFPQTTAPVAGLFAASGAIAGPPGVGGGTSGSGSGGPGSGNGGGCLTGPCGDGLPGLTLPVPIYQPDPEYSDEARKAKFQGTVIINLHIGTDGKVYNPKVIEGVGYGLDEKALAAVKNWRFEPARQGGRAVEVAANVEVNFRLY